MNFLGIVICYVVMGSCAVTSIIHYHGDKIGKACFFMIVAGILMIVHEVQRNGRIIYNHCQWIIPTDTASSQNNRDKGDGEH